MTRTPDPHQDPDRDVGPGADDDALSRVSETDDTSSEAPDQEPTPTPTRLWSRLRRRSPRIAHALATGTIALLGAVIGIQLVPATPVQVGPLDATVRMRPALTSDTAILLPPVGEISFDTHRAPVRIEARVKGVDIAAAEQLLYSDDALAELENTAPEALTDAALLNAGLNVLAATLGAGLVVGVTFRRPRRALVGAGTSAAVVAVSCGLIGATFRPASLNQPHFDGLLSQAAYIADLGHGTAVNYANYRATLAEFVGQVSALYIAADTLPGAYAREDLIAVLHVSDIHDNPQAYDVITQLDEQFGLDLVIDTGDIISWGTSWENDQLDAIGRLDVPYVFIKGNHDGAATAAKVAEQPNGIVLDNEIQEVAGLTIAGIGDPRFAADDDSDAGGWQAGKDAVAASAFTLGDTIEAHDAENPENPVDLALIHDPTLPEGLLGRVPVVLSGHIHRSTIEQDLEGSGTDLMTVGSTGGALASGGVAPVLEGEKPLDLTARMLFFDRETKRLVSYDDIVMGGLGLMSVSISRHQMPEQDADLVVPEDATEPATDIEQGEGEELPDEDRLTPPDPESPLPSDGGGEQPARDDEGADGVGEDEPADDEG